MITAAARRFIYSLVGPVLTSAGWTWTPPGSTNVRPRLAHGVAPEGMPYPLVVFQMLSGGNDQITNNGNRIWSTPTYLVKAVAQGSSTDGIEATVQAIDNALHVSRGRVSGGLVLDCVRVRPHELPELTDGKYYINAGGEYAFRIQEA